MIALSIIVLATFTQALISSCRLHVDNLLQAVADLGNVFHLPFHLTPTHKAVYLHRDE